MVFGIGVNKVTECVSINIRKDNINEITTIVSYTLMLEKEKELINIEYKFYCAVMCFAIKFYKLNDLKLLIGNNINDIKKIICQFINSINYINLKINTASSA